MFQSNENHTWRLIASKCYAEDPSILYRQDFDTYEFHVKKAPNEEIVLKLSIKIACNKTNVCRFNSPQSHIRIKGEFA